MIARGQATGRDILVAMKALPSAILVIGALAGSCVVVAVENPTGDCVAVGSGDIACYSFSGPGYEWMLDCDHPLDRIYWRVHADVATGTAGMLPRPDGAGLVYGICDGADADLAALFDRNHLCVETLDAAGVEAVNAMSVTDALAISHALHERLVFRAEGTAITPWPLPEDLEAACPATSAADACTEYLDVICGDTDLGVLLAIDEGQAIALATALNDLYGIDG